MQPRSRGDVRAMAAGLALSLALMAPAARAAAQGAGPDASDGFVAWAKVHAAPLAACPSGQDRRTLKAIGEVVGGARVVALGEPTHGAHEPLVLRNCLFRLLVEEAGFTAIAIESGMHVGSALQAYVAGGPGDPGELAREHLTWGFGRFAENAELLRWIHDYNAAPDRRRRIAFYGVDMSGGDASGEWAKAPRVLQGGLDDLRRRAPRASADVRRVLEPLVPRFTRSGYAAMSAAERAGLSAALGRALDLIDRRDGRLGARSGKAAHAWAGRDLVLARQLVRVFEASLAEGAGDELSAQSYRADEARDAAMAANLLWILKREGPRGRVLLFAHNGHVMNAATRGGVWSVYARPARSMGQGLRAALGRRMSIILTSSSSPGPGQSPRPDGLGDLDAALDRVRPEAPGFLLDIRKARSVRAAGAWLAAPRSIRTNYATEQIMVPRRAFDAVIHLRRLTAAQAPSSVPAAAKGPS